jgi:hypothetical protein
MTQSRSNDIIMEAINTSTPQQPRAQPTMQQSFAAGT